MPTPIPLPIRSAIVRRSRQGPCPPCVRRASEDMDEGQDVGRVEALGDPTSSHLADLRHKGEVGLKSMRVEATGFLE